MVFDISIITMNINYHDFNISVVGLYILYMYVLIELIACFIFVVTSKNTDFYFLIFLRKNLHSM